MKPSFQDNFTTVYSTDALSGLKALPERSVHMAVTSPPYWGLRSYLPADHPKKELELGAEKTPEEYVEKLVEIFRALREVLRHDGTLWLNLGSSYANGGVQGPQRDTSGGFGGRDLGTRGRQGYAGASANVSRPLPPGFKPKDLIPIPWMVALGLQRDGWYLRSDCLWLKGNPMPSSTMDRPTASHEYVLMLTKKPRYYFDMEAVKELSVSEHPSGNGFKRPQQLARGGRGKDEQWQPTTSRNLRTAWHINCKPYSGSHYAVFPIELPLRCIRASTSEKGVCSECGAPYERVVERGESVERGEARHPTGRNDMPYGKVPDSNTRGIPFVESRTIGWQPTCSHDGQVEPATVLDPFVGSGTTALAARKLGKKSIGFDLDGRNVKLIEERLGYQGVMF